MVGVFPTASGGVGRADVCDAVPARSCDPLLPLISSTTTSYHSMVNCPLSIDTTADGKIVVEATVSSWLKSAVFFYLI